MKRFLYALLAIIILWWGAIWISNSTSWSDEWWTFFSNLFGSDENTANDDGDMWDDDMMIEDLVICPEWQIATEDPMTGESICIEAEPVDTQCLWLDGEAYDQGEEEIRFKVAYKTDEDLNPECETLVFTCTDSEFQSEEEWSDMYDRAECVIIDETDEDFVTCEFENRLYVPGETRYQYVEDVESADQDCIYIGIFCGWDGEWFTNFDLDEYEFQECSFEEQLDSEFMDENRDELVELGYLEMTEEGEYVQTWLTPGDLVTSGTSCITPWEETVEHGKQVLSFRDLVQPFDEECHIMTSECINGEWLPERERANIYDYPTCKINPPANCQIGNYSIYHNGEKELFATGKYVEGKRECSSQTRNCRDGELDGDEEYVYLGCTAPAAPTPKATVPVAPVVASDPDCPNPYVGGGSKWKSDQTGVGYTESSVSWLGSCESVPLVCKHGTIRIGNTVDYGLTIGRDYHTNCVKGTPNSCNFNWLDAADQSIPHTSFVTYYTVDSVPFGSSCDPKLVVDGTQCNDGKFTVVNKWYKTCEVSWPAACTFDYIDAGDISIAHEWSKAYYTTSSVPFGQKCEERVAATTCTNGSLTVTQGYKNCVEQWPAACTFDYLDRSDTTVNHTDTETFYTRSSVPFGESCSSYRSTTTCTNGSLSIGQGYANCVEEEPVSCSTPCAWTIAHGQTVQTYQSSSVSYNSTCSTITSTCTNGRLFPAAGTACSCQVRQPESCTSSCGTIPHGSSVTTYPSSSVWYTSTCSATVSTCTDGSLFPAAGNACSCQVQQPKNCANGMFHGQTITRYNESGCNGNQNGDNLDGWSNSNCQCVHWSITCSDWVTTQTPNYPGDGYPQGTCQ